MCAPSCCPGRRQKSAASGVHPDVTHQVCPGSNDIQSLKKRNEFLRHGYKWLFLYHPKKLHKVKSAFKKKGKLLFLVRPRGRYCPKFEVMEGLPQFCGSVLELPDSLGYRMLQNRQVQRELSDLFIKTMGNASADENRLLMRMAGNKRNHQPLPEWTKCDFANRDRQATTGRDQIREISKDF